MRHGISLAVPFRSHRLQQRPGRAPSLRPRWSDARHNPRAERKSVLAEVLMSVHFMDVVAGDVVHLGGLQVLEIQTRAGRRFRIVAGKHAGLVE
jgi:hypothetical protein